MVRACYYPWEFLHYSDFLCFIKIKSHLPNKSLPEIAGSICEIFALVISLALKFRSHRVLVLRCCPTQIYGV